MFDFDKNGYMCRDTYIENIILNAIEAARDGADYYDLPNDDFLPSELDYIRYEVERRLLRRCKFD